MEQVNEMGLEFIKTERVALILKNKLLQIAKNDELQKLQKLDEEERSLKTHND
jgi:hypothetical protein